MAISQTINPMVNVPSITNIATFEADVDYTLNTGLQTRADEMNAYATQANTTADEMNALAAAMSLNSTNDTSASSVLIGTGSKTFTVSASKSYVKGMYVVVANTSAPTVNSMFGIVDSYSGTTLVVVVVSIRGSGTYTAWTISQSAAGATVDSYTRSNILGTVSQSGGVPTGAVIETGTNANGTFTKYADGTMFCSHTVSLGSQAITSANGNIFIKATAIVARTFPAAFSAVPVCHMGCYSGSGLVWLLAANAPTVTETQAFYPANPVSITTTVTLYFIAIGRWY